MLPQSSTLVISVLSRYAHYLLSTCMCLYRLLLKVLFVVKVILIPEINEFLCVNKREVIWRIHMPQTTILLFSNHNGIVWHTLCTALYLARSSTVLWNCIHILFLLCQDSSLILAKLLVCTTQTLSFSEYCLNISNFCSPV